MSKRKGLERPHCTGKWTRARFNAFIRSLLRSGTMRWGPKYDAIKGAFVKQGINPRTGRKCKLFRCEGCGKLHPQSALRADHIEPVVDIQKGFQGWDEYIKRMFCELDGFQVLCDPCHTEKTNAEMIRRKVVRKSTRKRVRRVRK